VRQSAIQSSKLPSLNSLIVRSIRAFLYVGVEVRRPMFRKFPRDASGEEGRCAVSWYLLCRDRIEK
jgi:hypothetical protein